MYPNISTWVLCKNITLWREYKLANTYWEFTPFGIYIWYGEMFWLLSPCCVLWQYVKVVSEVLWNIQGWTRYSLPVLLACLHDKPGTMLIDPCQNYSPLKLLQKDLNSFVPCHQNVCSFFYTSTPGSISAQHLLQYFEFVLFIFSPDVHFMWGTEVTASHIFCRCSALPHNHTLLN